MIDVKSNIAHETTCLNIRDKADEQHGFSTEILHDEKRGRFSTVLQTKEANA